ncbi:MAG: hypothetical protein ACNA8H_02745, partial [Anaerolineales bacterium]
MKSTNIQNMLRMMNGRFHFVNLLTLIAVLLAASGASPIQAAVSGEAYIIVFKDTVDVPAAVPALS